MARVLPSDAVRTIERLFPRLTNENERERNHPIGISSSEYLAAVVALVEQIPEELLVLNAEDHIAFVCSVAAARHLVDLWQSSSLAEAYVLGELRGFEPRTPLTIIRDCLQKCPDQSPAASAHDLAFITDVDLRASVRLDISEAERNLADGSWKAATVLAGSAIEALLLWAVLKSEEQNPGCINTAVTACRTAGTLKQQPSPNPEMWTLNEYAAVSEALKIVEHETAVQVGQARGFRNLIHPGRARRLQQECDRGTAFAAAAALYCVARDLTPRDRQGSA